MASDPPLHEIPPSLAEMRDFQEVERLKDTWDLYFICEEMIKGGGEAMIPWLLAVLPAVYNSPMSFIRTKNGGWLFLS